VKIKSRSRFQVEVDGDVNDEVIKRNDVFQMNELIESYQVILSTELKKIQILMLLRIFILILMS
jgi:hypothetical protein